MILLKKLHNAVYTTFNVRRALGFVWASSKGWALVQVVLLLVQGLLPVVSVYLLKLLVDSLASPTTTNSPNNVYLLLTAVGAIMLLTGLMRTVGALVDKEETRRIVDYMHDVIQQKAVDIDLEYYENPDHQDSLHRAQKEATFRPGIIVRAMNTIFRNTVSLIGVAWLLLVFKWPVLLLLLCAVLPGVVVRFVFSAQEYLAERNYTAKERRAAYYHWMMVGKDQAKEIRLLRLGNIFLERFRALRTQLRQIRLALDKKSTLYATGAHVISTLLVFTAYFWVARDALLGLVSIGSFVMFYQAFQKGQMFLQAVLEGITSLYENNLFLTNLYEFLDYENRISASCMEVEPTNGTAGQIEICNVHFTYPSTSEQVLSGVSMTIDPGQVVAIVGLNGSGKTTLVKLICRLYDVQQGVIRIDGTDISALDPKAVQEKISVLFQDYAHYNLSVNDNVWFGDIEKPCNSSHIEVAVEKSGAAGFIQRLPEDYKTVLGRMFDRGYELSEGQWQKIALARAFFRDAKIIILDEPTAALDPKSEYELFSSLKRLISGKTVLLISHRMSTVCMADKIFVLNNGQIAESGTHEELMSVSGLYSELFETQAGNFRKRTASPIGPTNY